MPALHRLLHPRQYPAKTRPAGPDDQLDWDVERDGRMRDHAGHALDVPTVPYTPKEG